MKLTLRELVTFSMLGTLMTISKFLTEFLPNVHLLGVLVITYTVVYRAKALYPLYVFVFLTGLIYGFPLWWIPYLYLWTVLWGAAMLLPKTMPRKLCPIVYMVLCSLHGLLYGTLYAPAQALLFGLNWQEMVTWIVAGLPWDMIHGVSNLFAGILIYPLVLLLRKIERRAGAV